MVMLLHLLVTPPHFGGEAGPDGFSPLLTGTSGSLQSWMSATKCVQFVTARRTALCNTY